MKAYVVIWDGMDYVVVANSSAEALKVVVGDELNEFEDAHLSVKEITGKPRVIAEEYIG